MSINKSLLEKKSTKDLENYIKQDSKFVTEAIVSAFEILEKREYSFTESDLERWNILKSKEDQLFSKKDINPNYSKAANIWYISVSLGLINIIFINSNGIFQGIFTLLLLFGLGYLISKEYDWMKYLLLGMFILGLLIMLFTFSFYESHPVVIIINIIQTILQVWVLVILFQIHQNA